MGPPNYEEAPKEYYDQLFDELEVDLEIDGFYCRRCGDKMENYTIPDEPHDCIECSECGEHDMCICDTQRCQHCSRPGLDCNCLHCYDCGKNINECSGHSEDYEYNDFDEVHGLPETGLAGAKKLSDELERLHLHTILKGKP